MRAVVIAVLLASSIAHAEWTSPQIAAVAKRPGTAPAFWKRVAATGTPLVEDVGDPSGKLLVTFVYRAAPRMAAVAMLGAPHSPVGHAQLARVRGTDVFAWSVLVEPEARIAYSFLPDDSAGAPDPHKGDPKRFEKLVFDPLNKTSLNVKQSLATLPKAPAQPWLVPKPGTPIGDLVSYTVKSKLLGGDRAIGVYTPPSFSRTAGSYPLVVMFDGPAAPSMLGLTIQLDELIAAKKIPPVVVLLVGNANRVSELQNNAAFADYIALDLVPWMRRQFNVTSDPTRAVIAGISLGGVAAAYAAARHPAVFGNVLSQSGSFWWGSDEPEQTARDYSARPARPIRFWLEAGTLEETTGDPSLLTANRHFRDVLRARGYDHVYSEFAGGHAYVNWRGTIAAGLIALLAFPARPSTKPVPAVKHDAITFTPTPPTLVYLAMRRAILEGGTATVAWLSTQTDDKLVAESAINQVVYVLAGLGHARAALPIAEWNAKRFPSSANAHDTLAEMLSLTSDTKRAIAEYQRSLALDPKNDAARRVIAMLRARP